MAVPNCLPLFNNIRNCTCKNICDTFTKLILLTCCSYPVFNRLVFDFSIFVFKNWLPCPFCLCLQTQKAYVGYVTQTVKYTVKSTLVYQPKYQQDYRSTGSEGKNARTNVIEILKRNYMNIGLLKRGLWFMDSCMLNKMLNMPTLSFNAGLRISEQRWLESLENSRYREPSQIHSVFFGARLGSGGWYSFMVHTCWCSTHFLPAVR